MALKTKAEQIQLLEETIEASGLSVTEFAERVLVRESRTVRRWLTGDSPIPKKVQDWLEHPEKAPWPR